MDRFRARSSPDLTSHAIDSYYARDVTTHHDHVGLRNGRTRPDGGPSLEMVAGFHLPPNRFRLLDSPWTLYGCASGDVLEVGPGEGEWRVVEWGRRISVQCFLKHEDPSAARAIEPLVTSAGGTLDNISTRRDAFVYSFPETVGHRAIVAFMSRIEEQYPHLEWGYGNVYRVEDGDGSGVYEWVGDFLSR